MGWMDGGGGCKVTPRAGLGHKAGQLLRTLVCNPDCKASRPQPCLFLPLRLLALPSLSLSSIFISSHRHSRFFHLRFLSPTSMFLSYSSLTSIFLFLHIRSLSPLIRLFQPCLLSPLTIPRFLSSQHTFPRQLSLPQTSHFISPSLCSPQTQL